RQQDVDRHTRPAPEERTKPGDGEAAGERFLPERGVERHLRTAQRRWSLQRRCVDDRHAPELPRVGESECAPVGEEDLTAHVALVDIVDAIEQLAGHPERDNERLTAIQVENDELPATTHAADPPAPKPRRYDL